jgi:hypothetical protein
MVIVAITNPSDWSPGITAFSFHHVSKGHLHRYCAEFEFHWNNRIALGVNDGERAARIVTGAEGKCLTY